MSDDLDFERDTKVIRRWVWGGTVSTVEIAAELRAWADYFSPDWTTVDPHPGLSTEVESGR